MSTISPTPPTLKNPNGLDRCRSGAIVSENRGVGDGEREMGEPGLRCSEIFPPNHRYSRFTPDKSIILGCLNPFSIIF